MNNHLDQTRIGQSVKLIGNYLFDLTGDLGLSLLGIHQDMVFPQAIQIVVRIRDLDHRLSQKTDVPVCCRSPRYPQIQRKVFGHSRVQDTSAMDE